MIMIGHPYKACHKGQALLQGVMLGWFAMEMSDGILSL